MLDTLVNKLRQALKNEDCSLCHSQAVTAAARLCAECQKALNIRGAFPLIKRGDHTVYAAAMFNKRLKRQLYPFKFYNRMEYAPLLSDVLVDYWQTVVPTVDSMEQTAAKRVCVVPIPSRWKENHMTRVAQPFARDMGYRFSDALLTWERDTLPQHRLTGKRKRWENVKESMQVSTDADVLTTFQNTDCVIIVDDITTTGATFFEASQAFYRMPDFKGQVICLSLSYVPLGLHRQIS